MSTSLDWAAVKELFTLNDYNPDTGLLATYPYSCKLNQVPQQQPR